MSVIVKGMNLPRDCFVCPFARSCGEEAYCAITSKFVSANKIIDTKRPQFCPLEEANNHKKNPQPQKSNKPKKTTFGLAKMTPYKTGAKRPAFVQPYFRDDN